MRLLLLITFICHSACIASPASDDIVSTPPLRTAASGTNAQGRRRPRNAESPQIGQPHPFQRMNREQFDTPPARDSLSPPSAPRFPSLQEERGVNNDLLIPIAQENVNALNDIEQNRAPPLRRVPESSDLVSLLFALQLSDRNDNERFNEGHIYQELGEVLPNLEIPELVSGSESRRMLPQRRVRNRNEDLLDVSNLGGNDIHASNGQSFSNLAQVGQETSNHLIDNQVSMNRSPQDLNFDDSSFQTPRQYNGRVPNLEIPELVGADTQARLPLRRPRNGYGDHGLHVSNFGGNRNHASNGRRFSNLGDRTEHMLLNIDSMHQNPNAEANGFETPPTRSARNPIRGFFGTPHSPPRTPTLSFR